MGLISIQNENEQDGKEFHPVLMRAAQAALGHQQAGPDAALSIVLADDARLQQLNHAYLDIDAPTDVLSFPSGETDPDSGEIYLGDIIISVPRAKAQAEAGGHAIEQELELLVVHGVLHLLGHDHYDEDEKAAMWVEQAKVLEDLGNPLSPEG
ncbi:MAG: rRNA maturation RNase YbeY [Anaerolineales bacterium]|nr:rRNA maturation RNase YbeY [Anaerolineales bacterium]